MPDSEHFIKDDPEHVNFLEETDQSISIDSVHRQTNISEAPGEADDQELNNLMFTTMTDSDYISSKSSLNTEQLKAFQMVEQYFQSLQLYKQGEVNNKPDPLHLFISGPGGTGKSHVISLIKELVIRSSLDNLTKDSPAVIVTATGVAAYNVQGVTLHRALNLPVQHGPSPKYVPLKGERLADMRKHWRNTNTIIIDEISMVSYEMFVHIHRRLNDIKCNDSVFGGVNVVCLGDFYQLPPVAPGSFIFSGTSEKTHLWRDLFTMIELTQNMRQKDDLIYAELLLRVRTACHTKEDVELLKSRLSVDIDHNFDSALDLYPILKSCDIYNNRKQQTLSHYTDVFTIMAHHGFVEGGKTNIVPPEYIPDDDRQCAGLQNILQLSVGSIVMLRRNINTSESLVNGARGIVTGFVWKDGISPLDTKSGIMPEQINVRFFKSNGSNTDSDSSSSIMPMTVEFYGEKIICFNKKTISFIAVMGCNNS